MTIYDEIKTNIDQNTSPRLRVSYPVTGNMLVYLVDYDDFYLVFNINHLMTQFNSSAELIQNHVVHTVARCIRDNLIEDIIFTRNCRRAYIHP